MRWKIKKYIFKRDGLEATPGLYWLSLYSLPHPSQFRVLFDSSFFFYWLSNCSALVVARIGNSVDGLSIWDHRDMFLLRRQHRENLAGLLYLSVSLFWAQRVLCPLGDITLLWRLLWRVLLFVPSAKPAASKLTLSSPAWLCAWPLPLPSKSVRNSDLCLRVSAVSGLSDKCLHQSSILTSL